MDWIKFISEQGWPAAFTLLVFWVLWKKVWPMVEANQKAMRENQTKLVDKTIEIQTANKESLEKLPELIERLLRSKPPL